MMNRIDRIASALISVVFIMLGIRWIQNGDLVLKFIGTVLVASSLVSFHTIDHQLMREAEKERSNAESESNTSSRTNA